MGAKALATDHRVIQFLTPIKVEYIKKNLDITKPRYSERISGTANDCFL